MNLIIPAKRIIEKTLTIDPVTNEQTETSSNGGYFLLSEEDENLLFSKINCDITIFFLWNMTENRDVWAAVFFPDPIPNSDELLKARGDLKSKLIFAAYGNVTPGMTNPPLGAFSIQSKASLKVAAERL